MTQADGLIFAGIAIAVLGYIFFKLVAGSGLKDQAGPHNNWRQNRKVGSDTSESSGQGSSGGICGGDGGGGGD